MTEKSLYEILGVSKTASQSTIKHTYKRKASKLHPDKGGDEEQFKLLQVAYSVLSDPARRQQYDETGTFNKTFTSDRSMLLCEVVKLFFATLDRMMERFNDISHLDIKKAMLDEIDNAKRKTTINITENTKKVSRLEKVLSKITCKGENDYLSANLQSRIDDAKRLTDQATAYLTQLDGMVEEVNLFDFSYEPERGQTSYSPPTSSIQLFLNAGM